jgi:hypothetical protein
MGVASGYVVGLDLTVNVRLVSYLAPLQYYIMV